jgi:hypothetical protein
MTLEHFDTIFAFVVIITGVSLLVTTLTQMASGFLGLRGTNLRWGIKTLLANVDPKLAEYAEVIAERALQHPLISDSTFSGFAHGLTGRWKLANAIRKEELVKILRLLAKPPADGAATDAPHTWDTALGQSLDKLKPEDTEKLMAAAPEIKKLFPGDPAKADRVMAQLMSSAEQLTGDIDQWFDTIMDRVSQRFAMHARLWTVLFSIVLAFALQLDAIKLFTTLSSDAELRSRVVASADALSKKADEILVTSSNGTSAVYVEAMKQMIASHTNELRALPEPAGFASLPAGKEWLETQLKGAKISGTSDWQKIYEEQVPQASLRSAAEIFNSILRNKLKFDLVPDPYPEPFYRDWVPTERPFWGILASVALLSLGAPFWFNMLKTLSNLRPTVAQKEQKETEQALKQSGDE